MRKIIKNNLPDVKVDVQKFNIPKHCAYPIPINSSYRIENYSDEDIKAFIKNNREMIEKILKELD